ncbi:MaoC family dehydratase [Mangrovicoccus algicola]|uniref:MaoC family dehydratase n=1 Tax=Mangrovicoccus algicola TaxID=2771008 RepID=A0A8J6YXA7_9RHOB|nr:MaoC family dehydratase [Mangrovicoccus algicola]MBE3637536.1 MaoC family dehydratase [Mangrovicoccus algicola]
MTTGTVHLEDLTIGMSRSLTKRVTPELVEKFADVSEDRNPIHLDEAAGKASIFGERIAHGMLSAILFSALLGERLPGHGTIYLGQTLKFLAPVKIGEEVTATVTVREIQAEKKRVILDCTAEVAGKTVIAGEATVIAPSRG